MNRLANIMLILAVIASLASACCAGWTGVIIYVSDPRSAWNETSDCPPCNQVCGDLSRFVPGTSWRVGFTQYKPNGEANHIAIMKALPGEPTPYFESVLDGRTVRTVEGYRGGIETVTDLYPGPKVTRVRQTAPYQTFGYQQFNPIVYGSTQVYRGICVNGVCY